MTDRNVEVAILKFIKDKNKKFYIYPTCDFKLMNMQDLKIPRVVSKTYSNAIIGTLNEQENTGNNYIGHKEITTHKHVIQLTFLLDNNFSKADVEKIRNHLRHKLGTRHYFLLKGINLIIQKVGDIVDISEHTKDEYIERYAIDIEVTSVDECIANVEVVKKVKYEIGGNK